MVSFGIDVIICVKEHEYFTTKQHDKSVHASYRTIEGSVVGIIQCNTSQILTHHMWAPIVRYLWAPLPVGTSTRGHFHMWALPHVGTSTCGYLHPSAPPPVGTSSRGHLHPWVPPHVGTSTRGHLHPCACPPVGTSTRDTWAPPNVGTFTRGHLRSWACTSRRGHLHMWTPPHVNTCIHMHMYAPSNVNTTSDRSPSHVGTTQLTPHIHATILEHRPRWEPPMCRIEHSSVFTF